MLQNVETVMPGAGGEQPRLCRSAVIANNRPQLATQHLSRGEVNCTETAWQRGSRVRSSPSRPRTTRAGEQTVPQYARQPMVCRPVRLACLGAEAEMRANAVAIRLIVCGKATAMDR